MSFGGSESGYRPIDDDDKSFNSASKKNQIKITVDSADLPVKGGQNESNARLLASG